MPPATHRVVQRTRILVDPSKYLSTREAQTLTGHTPPTLALRVEEGALAATRVARTRFAYETASVVDYCAGTNTPTSLFDLVASAAGEQITEEDLTTELEQAPAGVWWTLLRRDHSPPDWPSWTFWYGGDTARAEAALAGQYAQWAQEIEEHQARGLVRRTLWMPTQPLASFGEYCLARYRHVVVAGGRVRVLPAWKIAHLEHVYMLPEMEVTARSVYVRCYTRFGSRAGAIRITDPDLVDAMGTFLTWADEQHTLPLSDFTRWRRRGVA